MGTILPGFSKMVPVVRQPKLRYDLSMNNRDYKQFAEGEIYHVYNRGVGKMDIFRDHDDYLLLISRLREALHPGEQPSTMAHDMQDGAHLAQPVRRRYVYPRKKLPAGAFTLIAYCLMPNHYHFLVRQNGSAPVSKLILNVFGGYAKCFNKKYDRVGSLFQDQFKAVRVDSDEYLRWVSAYIHANPLVARMVDSLDGYPYSSYPDLAGLREGTLCDASPVLSQFGTVADYASFVSDVSAQTGERKAFTHVLIDEDL